MPSNRQIPRNVSPDVKSKRTVSKARGSKRVRITRLTNRRLTNGTKITPDWHIFGRDDPNADAVSLQPVAVQLALASTSA